MAMTASPDAEGNAAGDASGSGIKLTGLQLRLISIVAFFTAWEIAGRLSHIDLNDANVMGGRLTDTTFGLNWYLNRRIRLMTNLVKVLDVNRPGSEFHGLDPLIFSLRLQWVVD